GLSAAASAAMTPKTSVAEEVANCLGRAVDVLVGVGERDEEALELRRRHVDPALEQVPEQRAVALDVARLRILEVPDRPICRELVGEEERGHRADALDAPERRDPGLEPRSLQLEL